VQKFFKNEYLLKKVKNVWEDKLHSSWNICFTL
jgi:hypothetical protein